MAKVRALALAHGHQQRSEDTVKPWVGDFASLYREHQGLVRSVIFQIAGADAIDDLVQESFIKIWRGISGFREDAKLSSWIYRVSVNIALDHCRARARRFETSQGIGVDEQISSAPGPDQGASDRDLVRKGLMVLSEEHRVVLVLSLLQEQTISEIAEILEISEGTVKSRLHYAKAQFREYLSSMGVEL